MWLTLLLQVHTVAQARGSIGGGGRSHVPLVESRGVRHWPQIAVDGGLSLVMAAGARRVSTLGATFLRCSRIRTNERFIV
jgi:hypothetical protein